MKKVALVLSGGGSLGAAHIGATEALAEKGYTFDFYAGVSAGAIIASLLACGKTPQESEVLIKKRKLLALAFDFSTSHHGILRGDKVKNLLDNLYEGKRIEELPHPLYIGATNFQNGERIIINSGLVSDAVRASISVPVLFKPYFHPELELWLADGGLTQNLPLDLATENYKGQKIIAIDVVTGFDPNIDFAEQSDLKRLKNLRKTMERAFRIMFAAQQKNFKEDPRVTKIKPELRDFTSLDIFALKKIIERGRKAVLNSKL